MNQSDISAERLDSLVEWLKTKSDIRAVIFDLDGTMLDNNPFHLKAWKQYLTDAGIHISEDEYNAHINGRTNKDAIEYIYKRKMTDEEAMKFALEKEAVYREIYAPHIQPVAGLIEFIAALKRGNIAIGMATSGVPVNIDFMFEHVPVRAYFDVIVHSAHIKKGKPDPEIYTKTASLLNVSPRHCLVFEDAAVGIQAAKAAGMHVAAIDTTQPAEQLAQADFLISDFRFLTGRLSELPVIKTT